MELIALQKLEQGRYLRRYKRFFMDVETGTGTTEVIHCANTGSMRSCLEENATVYSLRSPDPRRKLASSLELMKLHDGLACLNTQRANQLVDKIFSGMMKDQQHLIPQHMLELLRSDFPDFVSHRREAQFADGTRFDFCISHPAEKLSWVEVKSVSLRLDANTLAFPDAVTERGQKHLRELTRAAEAGEGAFLFFVVMRSSEVAAEEVARSFRAAHEIDFKYGELLKTALSSGVKVRLIVPSITTSGIGLRGYFPYDMGPEI